MKHNLFYLGEYKQDIVINNKKFGIDRALFRTFWSFDWMKSIKILIFQPGLIFMSFVHNPRKTRSPLTPFASQPQKFYFIFPCYEQAYLILDVNFFSHYHDSKCHVSTCVNFSNFPAKCQFFSRSFSIVISAVCA